MNELSQPQLDWLVQAVTGWVHQVPMVSTLLILIGLDVAAGLLVAFDRKALSSTISWRGMTRKIFTILLVGMAAVIEPFAQGLPLAQIVAMFYSLTEAVSILENAAALGLPLPAQLVDVLAKLKDGQKMRADQKETNQEKR